MKGIIILVALYSSNCLGSLLSFSADFFQDNVAINQASPDLKVATGNEAPIYSVAWHDNGRDNLSAVLDSISPLGSKVFSSRSTTNSEWTHSFLEIQETDFRTIEALRDFSPTSFFIEFLRPVDYVNIYTAEIFQDAGWGSGSDPLMIFLYDSKGQLIHYGDEGPSSPLRHRDDYTPPQDLNPFSFTENRFKFPDITYVALGGHSEPTTIGRIDYRVASIPEPNSIFLFLLGSLFLLLKNLNSYIFSEKPFFNHVKH